MRIRWYGSTKTRLWSINRKIRHLSGLLLLRLKKRLLRRPQEMTFLEGLLSSRECERLDLIMASSRARFLRQIARVGFSRKKGILLLIFRARWRRILGSCEEELFGGGLGLGKFPKTPRFEQLAADSITAMAMAMEGNTLDGSVGNPREALTCQTFRDQIDV